MGFGEVSEEVFASRSRLAASHHPLSLHAIFPRPHFTDISEFSEVMYSVYFPCLSLCFDISL